MFEWLKIWATTVCALIAAIAAIAGFVKMYYEIIKLRLELQALKNGLSKSNSLIYKVTDKDIINLFNDSVLSKLSKDIESNIISEIKSRSLSLIDFLLNKSIENIRIQLDLWFEILKVSGNQAKGAFWAYEGLENTARDKNITLEYKIMTKMIGLKETSFENGKEFSIQMTGELVRQYLLSLDDLIKTSKIDKYNIIQESEQLALQLLSDSDESLTMR